MSSEPVGAPDAAALRRLRCRPLGPGARLDGAPLQAQLRALPQWTVVDGALERRFGFSDFHRTMAFVDALAAIAHAEDHHPELQVSYGRCTVRWSTHDSGGLTLNDFICAAKVDALLAGDGR